MGIVTLATDFGTQDWFVGAMKGVILRINPRATVVDITHEVPPGDIRAGAFALASSCSHFPKGTVHVAVVDPGVGSRRKAIVVQTRQYTYVGPDNGVLTLALERETIRSIRRLENEKFFLHPVSGSFHGRDIFAPVAAHLSRGVPLPRLGPPQKGLVRPPWPKPHSSRRGIEGEIVYIDRFGNAITNIRNEDLAAREVGEVWVGRRRLAPVKGFYQSVAFREAVAVPGSSGFLEIAINGGSATRRFGLQAGSTLTVR